MFAKAVILTGQGADTVSIKTMLPGPTYMDDCLWLNFQAAKGTGEAYVKKHFPDVEIKVIQR